MNLRLTIRNKLLLATCFILLVSYAILVHTTIRSINGFTEDQLSRQLNENLLFAKEQYVSRADKIRYSLQQPASSPPVQQWIVNRDIGSLKESVQRWRTILSFAEYVALVDADRRIIGAGDPHQTGGRFELSPLVEQVFREKQPVVSTEAVSRAFLCKSGIAPYCAPLLDETDALIMTVAIPVLTPDRKVLGVIVAGDVIDREISIARHVQEVFGKGVAAAVTQGDRWQVSTAEGRLSPRMPLPGPIMDKLRRGLPYRGEITVGGRGYRTALDPLINSRGDYVGTLSVAISRDDLRGMLHANLANIIVSVVVGLVLTVVMAYWMARRFATPLNDLAEGVRRIESGDLRQQVTVSTADEVGELADAFNRMAKSLEERDRTIRLKAHDLEELNQRLQELNEELERRVGERTADLRLEMGRLEAILTGMAEGIAVTDRDGRIILFNPAAQKLFEMVPHRVVGRSLGELSGRGEFCQLVDYIALMRENGDMTPQRDVDMVVRGKKLKVNLSPFADESGAYAGVVMSIRDVTAEEEVDRMKNEFISTVSHELKTPLTSIKGSLQLILQKGSGLDGIEGELLQVCLRNAERLIRLVNDILDIAKIESGGMEFQLAPQDIGVIVSQSVEELEGFAREHGIVVTHDVPTDLPRVFGDRDRLVQVLTNLMSNAVKFSPRGLPVTVSAVRSQNFVAVSVADRGREIQWADRGRLFKKFQQLDTADRRQEGGTGLGLAICKEIVERHHGRIFYAQGMEGGNVFTFTIPVYEEQA